MEMSVDNRLHQSEIAGRTASHLAVCVSHSGGLPVLEGVTGVPFLGNCFITEDSLQIISANPNHGPNGPSIKYKIKWTGISLFPSQHLINTVMMPRSRTYRTSQNRATRSGRAEDEAGWHDCARCCSFTLVL